MLSESGAGHAGQCAKAARAREEHHVQKAVGHRSPVGRVDPHGVLAAVGDHDHPEAAFEEALSVDVDRQARQPGADHSARMGRR